MSKSVRGLLTSLKRREPLPRIDGEVPADIAKSLRPTRNISEKVSQVVRLRKAGKWNEIQAINLIHAYADIIVKVEAEPDNKPDLYRRDYIERRFKTHIMKLDSLLLEYRIPSIMYLRVHSRLRNPMQIHYLPTPLAINKFTDWMESELSSRFEHSEDMKEYVRTLSSWQSEGLKQLLEEWSAGNDYLDKALGGSILIDRGTAALVEMNHLPGAFLLTIPEVMELHNAGSLPFEVSERIELSSALLREGDTRKRFSAEIKRRTPHGLVH